MNNVKLTSEQLDREEYNQMVLDEAFDSSGHSCDVDCPCCGKQAIRRDFDELLGGCINQVYTINCNHCGHHQCDQEYCRTCESIIENEKSDVQEEIESMGLIGDIIDAFLDNIEEGKSINPVDFSFLKVLIRDNEGSIYYSDMPNASASDYINLVKRKLLDAKFKRNLEVKISQHLDAVA